jgi:putative tryptophan/tyrosine transport system substrate-binding protein
MSFGGDLGDRWRLGATYIDRILMGGKPETLLFQQPTRFQLVINLKAVRALGVMIPQSIPAVADKGIE